MQIIPNAVLSRQNGMEKKRTAVAYSQRPNARSHIRREVSRLTHLRCLKYIQLNATIACEM